MTFSSAAQKEMDRLYQNRGHVELSIGILRDGRKELLRFGPDRKQKDDDELVYPVGSICKPFAASMLAKQIAEGKLDLKVPINAYLPDMPGRYYPDLEKLATHTPGIRRSRIQRCPRFRFF